MRFLADENVPTGVIEELMKASHDVESVAKLTLGVLDPEVLRQAAAGNRILLTFDKDHGELAYRSDISILPAGVVLVRLAMPKTREACRDLALVLTAREDWAGHFSVIEPGRIRRRQLRSGL
jgi:predicted nuclease of predicted toxin-antitoxin system